MKRDGGKMSQEEKGASCVEGGSVYLEWLSGKGPRKGRIRWDMSDVRSSRGWKDTLRLRCCGNRDGMGWFQELKRFIFLVSMPPPAS
jgi:hypothetical protein